MSADELWQVSVGSDAIGWRDVTVEASDLVFSHVRPGGPASCSFTMPADIWGRGYNELQPGMRAVVRYAGLTVWDGYILPRGLSYEGE